MPVLHTLWRPDPTEAAGGRLDPAAADAVRGVGPVLLERWEALRPR